MDRKTEKKQVIILGGGAAGLIAALAAADAGACVTVLEQNARPGKKILATGNGRCNLTNLNLDDGRYRYGEGHTGEYALFVRRILRQFPVEETLLFFQKLGIEPIDKKGWVYPYSGQASSVLDVLLWEAGRLGVKIKTREKVCAVQEKDGREHPFLVVTEGWQYPADAVILASGSPASVPENTGDFAGLFAEQIHVKMIPFLPALCPVRIKEKKCASFWAGTRISASVRLFSPEGKLLAEETGEVQLTETGISGIPVFQISHEAIRRLASGKKLSVLLDFFPFRTEEELQKLLETRSTNAPEKTMPQLLTGLFPDRLIRALLWKADSGNGENAKNRGKGKNSPKNPPDFPAFAHLCKAFSVTPVFSASYKQAQVCSGGIALYELTDHLEFRKHPGLFCAGEAADVDGPCGGYNLQWAWSSGYVAGRAAAGDLPEYTGERRLSGLEE